MQIAIAGGNGFIGRRLTRQLLDAGHEVVWLSHRTGRVVPPRVREVTFQPTAEEGDWIAEIAAADAVVNLSGYPISSRWTPRVKELLLSSRVDTARAIRHAIEVARAQGAGPNVYVGASAVGIYGEGHESVLDEESPTGEDWLARLAVEWEAASFEVAETGCRVATIRTGLVLGAEGLVPKMALPMTLFVGGPVGSGRQWTPWVHHDDIAGIYRFAIENVGVDGPLNACAPEGVRMRDFARELGRALRRPSWFPVPGFMLRVVLGEVAEYMLFSQRVSSQKLVEAGYQFRYPELGGALRAALRE